MPGHLAGKAFEGSGLALGLDTTELGTTDNLLSPQAGGALVEAEALAAGYWRAGAALFLAGGSTLGIQAMLLYYVGKGGRLLVSGLVHKAVFQMAALLDIEVVSLPSVVNDAEPRPLLPKPIAAEGLRDYLTGDRNFGAFLCTSPDYYGTICDLAAYQEVLSGFSIPLLVDMAHGAHLEAIYRWQGTQLAHFAPDAAVMSAHKTLPALTGGAILLARNPADAAGLRESLDIMGTSSPSLLVAASVDFARHFAESRGVAQVEKLTEAIRRFREGLNPLYQVWQGESHDPLRLVIDVSQVGAGTWVEAALALKGVNVEMADLTRLVCIVSLAAEEESLRVLQSELNGLATGQSGEGPWVQLDRQMAGVLAKAAGSRLLPLPSRRAVRRRLVTLKAVVAEGLPLPCDLVPYPPGIPLYAAGTVLTEDDRCLLEGLRTYGLQVDGLAELAGEAAIWLAQ